MKSANNLKKKTIFFWYGLWILVLKTNNLFLWDRQELKNEFFKFWLVLFFCFFYNLTIKKDSEMSENTTSFEKNIRVSFLSER